MQMMGRKENQSPQGRTARVLVEFLEVAITAVVFLKGVYPSGAFERTRYMNVVVQRARPSQLRFIYMLLFQDFFPFYSRFFSFWIRVNRILIKSIRREKGMVERVAVIFYKADDVPLEKIVFKLAVNQSYCSNADEADLEHTLRSFLIKLSVSESLTKDLPQDCKWEITAYFRSLPEASMSKEAELWIPTDTKQWHQAPLITPIKSMSSETLCLQLYLEQPSLSESIPWKGNPML